MIVQYATAQTTLLTGFVCSAAHRRLTETAMRSNFIVPGGYQPLRIRLDESRHQPAHAASIRPLIWPASSVAHKPVGPPRRKSVCLYGQPGRNTLPSYKFPALCEPTTTGAGDTRKGSGTGRPITAEPYHRERARDMPKRKTRAKKIKAETAAQGSQQRRTAHMHPKACVKCRVNFWSHDLYQLRCERCQMALDELKRRVSAKLKREKGNGRDTRGVPGSG